MTNMQRFLLITFLSCLIISCSSPSQRKWAQPKEVKKVRFRKVALEKPKLKPQEVQAESITEEVVKKEVERKEEIEVKPEEPRKPVEVKTQVVKPQISADSRNDNPKIQKIDEKKQVVSDSSEQTAIISKKSESKKQAGKKNNQSNIDINQKGYHKVVFHKMIQYGNANLQPSKLTIKVNETVVWINEDDTAHYVNQMPKYKPVSAYRSGEDEDDEDDDELINSTALNKGDKWMYTFKKKGVYNFYCYKYPLEFKGQIIVE